jgi:hypothetical protein
MDQRDLDNLKFLLDSSPEQIRVWYQQVSDDDLIYAAELMERYATYLETEVEFQRIDNKIAAMPVMIEAQAVIAMVRS